MKQHIADSNFGLNSRVQAVIVLLAAIEPTFANFHEKAQMFDVSFRTGIHYEEGLEPQVWIAMFPTMLPRGECTLVTVGLDISGQLKVETWGDIEDFPERMAPKDEWRTSEADPLYFKEISQAVDTIQRIFEEYYKVAHFKAYEPTRNSLIG